MPSGTVPTRFQAMLDSRELGNLATVDQMGRPQVNPVWFIADQTHFYLSVRAETAKYRNMRANPHVALSILDPARPDRYLELRGTVVDLELYEDLSWVNNLARKYTGADYTRGVAGEHRYKVTVRIDAWTGQG